MEYRLTVTMSEHGRREVAEDNAERLLNAFQTVHPEVGPVVGVDFEEGALDVTFSLDAEDARKAWELGSVVFAKGVDASGLEVTEVTGLEVEAVPAGELEEAEFQPA